MRIINARIERVPFPEYRAAAGYNWSSFKHALVAASYAKYKRENPTDGSSDGRLVHAMVLEPETVERDFVVSPFDSFRTKEAKAWRDSEKRDVVTQQQMDNCLALSDAVRASKFGSLLLTGAQCESTIYANVEFEPGFVVSVKGRVDFYRDLGDSLLAGDLKTCDDLTADDFVRNQVLKHHYAGQAAFYSELLSAATGKPVAEWHWLCANLNTHDVFPVQCGDSLLSAGANIWRRALRNYAKAVRSGEWRGAEQNENVVVAEAPGWYADKFGGETGND